MLIQDVHRHRRRRDLLRLVALLSTLLLLLLYIALRPKPSPYQNLPAEQLYCGAERVSRGQFVHNGIFFSGGQTQSADCAHYGRYGSFLPPADSLQTGMGYFLEAARPGQAYRASVWYRTDSPNVAHLAASVKGDPVYNWSSSYAVETDSTGWSKLELYCYVPYKTNRNQLEIYTYSTGVAPVCFDDLIIEPLPGPSNYQLPRLDISGAREPAFLSATDTQAVTLTTEGHRRLPAELFGIPGKPSAFGLYLPSDHTWKNMQRISLRPVKNTGDVEAWIQHQLWQRAGLITTRYDFTEVYYNKQSLGLYVYEEPTEPSFIYRYPYPDGPVIEVTDFAQGSVPLIQAVGSTADILPETNESFVQAQRLLMQYYHQETNLAEVFELEQLADYYAMGALLGHPHSAPRRWYYNPVVDKLYPVACGPSENSSPQQALIRQLLKEEAFTTRYLATLFRYSNPDSARVLLDPLASEWEARITYGQRAVRDSLPGTGVLLRSMQQQRDSILPQSPHTVTAYTQSVRGPVQQLKVINQHHLPIRLIGYGRKATQPQAGLESPLMLWPASWRSVDSDSLFTDIEIGTAANYLFYRLPGIEQLFAAPILPYPAPLGPTDWQDLTHKFPPKNDAGYTLSEQQLIFPAGEHKLTETLVIPQDYILVLQAGADIVLEQNASIISLGPVQATGQEGLPVKIRARYGGGGLAVLQAGTQSLFRYVLLENLRPPAYRSWQLRAGFTLYESDAILRNCAWLKGRGEAAVQTMRCTIESADCLISEAEGSGWSMEYCEGKLESCRFEQCEKSGMLLTGSQAAIESSVFLRNPMNALSATARSSVSARGGSVSGSREGIRATDQSGIRWSVLRMTDCQTGFAAFQKKPEFGPAWINISQLEAKSVGQMQRTDEQSRVIIE